MGFQPKLKNHVNIKWGRSIQGRLTIIFLVVTLVLLSGVGILSYLRSQAALEESEKNNLTNQVEISALFVDSWINERISDMETLAGLNRIRGMDPAEASTAVVQYFKQWGVYESVFVTDVTGNVVSASDGASFSVADRAYFKEAMQGKNVISEPLISKATGNIIFVVAVPVHPSDDSKEVIGILGGTLTTSAFNKILDASVNGETGEAFLVDGAGYLLTPSRFTDELLAQGKLSERAELELKVSPEIAAEISGKQTGTQLFVDARGHQTLAAYSPVTSTSWGVVAKVDTAEAFAAATTLRNTILIIMGILLAIMAVVSQFIARAISMPIKTITDSAINMAQGDVSQDVTYTSHDEVGVLAESFRTLIQYQREMSHAAEMIADGNLTASVTPVSERDVLGRAFEKMIRNLREQMEQINHSALTLKTASDQLSGASMQAGQATSQIAVTVQQIAQGINQQNDAITNTTRPVEQMVQTIDGVARGAQDQARSIARTTDLTHQLTAAIKQVASNAQAVSEGSKVASQAAEDGRNTIDHTITGMELIRNKVNLSSVKMTEMDQRSNQIGMIVETIEDIASQTNLLALNAAIEAARAGEHGKGFAVVADEVRKLAERSSLSTREIGSLVKSIQVTVNEAVAAMQESAQEVENGVSSANQAGKALLNIMSTIETVTHQAQQAAEAAQLMDVSAGNMTQAVESVSAVIEENTAATEEMAAGSSEITSAIENIASISEENSAAVEEVSASAEEMSAQVEEVSASAQSLADMANELETIVARFTLK
jgi:methyl-accepting chemotaxis protein